jgi:hypothetical protein
LAPGTDSLRQRAQGHIDPIDPRLHAGDLFMHRLEQLMAFEHDESDQLGQ